ncbi:winged helix-turn-helix domain-containing protein [Streptomyces avermitilis]|uniref:helix-turn-helix domain-containing protein n=1 Tax=Streptomyces avermitilis TaxID=33903 RepID=UPI003804F0E0
MFHVSYPAEGTWRLLKRHGWSWQQPARRAIEVPTTRWSCERKMTAGKSTANSSVARSSSSGTTSACTWPGRSAHSPPRTPSDSPCSNCVPTHLISTRK